MGPVWVDDGALRACDHLAKLWPGTRRIGLYQNEADLTRHTKITALEPASFSGYSGEQPLSEFISPMMHGDRAITYGAPVTWTYDGGEPSGWVTGYYVVDDDGALLWVEAREDGPVPMVSPGQVYSVTPALSTATRYGGEQ